MKNRIASQEKSQEELELKNKILIKSINNLRNLVGSLMKDVNGAKKEDKVFEKALRQLECQTQVDTEPTFNEYSLC